MKDDTKVIIGICVGLVLFFSSFFVGLVSQTEGLQSESTLYSGTVVSDNATDGIAQIVLLNSTGYWNVSCDISYHGTVPSETSFFHEKIIIPSAPTTVLGLQKGQNVTIDSGYYGCKVS